jgi:hypothetical protein
VHLLGVAPDSRTKSTQELIHELNFANTSKCRLLSSLDLGIRDQIYFISLFSSIMNRWKQIPCIVKEDLAADP